MLDGWEAWGAGLARVVQRLSNLRFTRTRRTYRKQKPCCSKRTWQFVSPALKGKQTKARTGTIDRTSNSVCIVPGVAAPVQLLFQVSLLVSF